MLLVFKIRTKESKGVILVELDSVVWNHHVDVIEILPDLHLT